MIAGVIGTNDGSSHPPSEMRASMRDGRRSRQVARRGLERAVGRGTVEVGEVDHLEEDRL
jgi:hypothetical protein